MRNSDISNQLIASIYSCEYCRKSPDGLLLEVYLTYDYKQDSPPGGGHPRGYPPKLGGTPGIPPPPTRRGSVNRQGWGSVNRQGRGSVNRQTENITVPLYSVCRQ